MGGCRRTTTGGVKLHFAEKSIKNGQKSVEKTTKLSFGENRKTSDFFLTIFLLCGMTTWGGGLSDDNKGYGRTTKS